MIQPIFDGHNDSLTRDDHAEIATGRASGHLDLPRMRAGGVRGAIFSVFTDSARRRTRRVRRARAYTVQELSSPVEHTVAAAHAAVVAGRLLALERSGHLRLARGVGDLDAAHDDSGPPAAVLHLEGAEAIDPQLEALPLWYEAGLRSLGPVWSRSNPFGHGVPFSSPSSPDIGEGLTDSGHRLIRACAELGILVDVSHLNEAGFWNVAALGVGPIVATHSGVHALCQSSRNLTDAQLDAIADSGGLVGIVFACPFLRADFADEGETPVDLIAEHARYVAERIGVEHVALGSDFDGATIPSDVGDVAGMPRVLDALAGAGFTTEEVAAIAWDNWRRVLGQWWHAEA